VFPLPESRCLSISLNLLAIDAIALSRPQSALIENSGRFWEPRLPSSFRIDLGPVVQWTVNPHSLGTAANSKSLRQVAPSEVEEPPRSCRPRQEDFSTPLGVGRPSIPTTVVDALEACPDYCRDDVLSFRDFEFAYTHTMMVDAALGRTSSGSKAGATAQPDRCGAHAGRSLPSTGSARPTEGR
jgi:hypothetical protein